MTASATAIKPHPVTSDPSARKPRRRRRHTGLWFTLPAMVVTFAVVGFPLLWALNLSFRTKNLLDTTSRDHYVGLANYKEVLSASEFRGALILTIAFVIATICLELVVGMSVALLLNQRPRGMGFFRLIFCLPLLLAPSVAGLQFRFLLADQYGAVNAILNSVGITGPQWLVDVTAARMAILMANLWLATPFVVLVLLAAMTSLPAEPFEAARLDGANAVQTFRLIMLPMLRPAILIILVVRLADAFRMFDLVYILTGGGPGTSTDVLSTYIYRETFVRAHFAQGAAASFLLVTLVAAVSFVFLRVLRPRD